MALPDRVSGRQIAQKAMLSNMDAEARQADALERIAAALERLCDHFMPVSAESVGVEPAYDPVLADPSAEESPDGESA
jgi:hypothetical protein